MCQSVRSLLFWLSIAVVLVGASVGSAQGLDDAEIQKAAEAMRQGGMPEAQIQKFLESAQGAQAALAVIESGEASFGITPEDAEGMARARETREFEAAHGAKPDAVVEIGSERFTLKVVKCQGASEMYAVRALGPPSERRLEANAGRTSLGRSTMHFRLGHEVSYDLVEGTASHFDGRRLRFDGLLAKSIDFVPTGERVRVRVEATCP